MLFRGKQAEPTVWRRFRAPADGFTFTSEEGYYAAHVVANSERVVNLFHALAEQLPPAVDVVLEDLRSGRSWKGEALPLDDVREQINRLKVLLARYGGVELSVFTSEDQLTLNPYLELFIYSRTDRWCYLLEGKGLEEQAVVRTKSWKQRSAQFPAASELVNAIQAAVERLSLQRA
ncbi:MAG TPA: hypothetical protein VKH19_16855 [Gemmatimonadaceae bacterium]|nr:hypothetical protein [Gemmatimonadaceae bacterium]